MNDETVKTVVTDRPETRRADNAGEVVNVPMKWWQILAVRAFRTFLQVFTMLLLPAMVIPTALPDGATGLILGTVAEKALVAFQFGLLGALGSLLMNGYELLQKIDVTNPMQRA